MRRPTSIISTDNVIGIPFRRAITWSMHELRHDPYVARSPPNPRSSTRYAAIPSGVAVGQSPARTSSNARHSISSTTGCSAAAIAIAARSSGTSAP